MVKLLDKKTWLAAQDFSLKPGIDFWRDITLVLNATTFQYLIRLIAQEGLHLYLMGDVTTHLYTSLENYIYMKLPKGFNLLNKAKFLRGLFNKIEQVSLWIKTITTYWYNHLSKYLLKE